MRSASSALGARVANVELITHETYQVAATMKELAQARLLPPNANGLCYLIYAQ